MTTLWTSEIYEPIYRAEIVVCIGSLVDFKQWVVERTGGTVDESDMHWAMSNAKTVEYSNDRTGVRAWYLWFPAWPTRPSDEHFRSLTHEAFHLTYQVFAHRRLPLTDSSQEAYAYYLEFLTASLWQAMASYDAARMTRTAKRKRRPR